MSAAFRILGMDKLLAQLDQLEATLAAKVLAKAARKAFKPVLDTAKALVPRDSGDLADSIKLSFDKSGGDAVVKVGLKIGVGRNSKQARLAAAAFGEGQSGRVPPARRWHFVELGTSKMAAKPFLRPALDANAGIVLELLKVELKAELGKVLRK